jgi:hypothetical protein
MSRSPASERLYVERGGGHAMFPIQRSLLGEDEENQVISRAPFLNCGRLPTSSGGREEVARPKLIVARAPQDIIAPTTSSVRATVSCGRGWSPLVGTAVASPILPPNWAATPGRCVPGSLASTPDSTAGATGRAESGHPPGRCGADRRLAANPRAAQLHPHRGLLAALAGGWVAHLPPRRVRRVDLWRRRRDRSGNLGGHAAPQRPRATLGLRASPAPAARPAPVLYLSQLRNGALGYQDSLV